MTENEQDIELLHTDPHQLILKYQKHVRIVVKRCISYGWFPRSEFRDLVQTVTTELLEKTETIRQQYNGTSFLRTYVSSIALNVCRKVREHQFLSGRSDSLHDTAVATNGNIVEPLMINEAGDALRQTLLLYGPRAPKIILFLTLLCHMPISRKDLLRCYPHCQAEDLASLITVFSGDYSKLTDIEIMQNLCVFINTMEHSHTSPDGYRRWIHDRILQICDILNGTPPHSHFTRENILFLFERYCLPVWQENGYIYNEKPGV